MHTKSDKVAAVLRLLGGGQVAPEEVRSHNEAAREELDGFFRDRIIPALSRLYQDGRLAKDGLACPEWRQVEEEWVKASEGSGEPCDVEKVKRLMREFIEIH